MFAPKIEPLARYIPDDSPRISYVTMMADLDIFKYQAPAYTDLESCAKYLENMAEAFRESDRRIKKLEAERAKEAKEKEIAKAKEEIEEAEKEIQVQSIKKSKAKAKIDS